MVMTSLKLPLFFAFLLLSPAAWANDDFTTQMLRATLKISHDKSTATGFLIATTDGQRPVLVTANHVLEGTPGDETTLLFRRLEAEGEYSKIPTKLAIRSEGKPLWAKHPTADVAAIAVELPEGADYVLIPAETIAGDEALRTHKVHPGENLTCLGYPHREEGSKAGFAIVRDGPIATYPLLPTAKTKTFFLSANTFEGDSGGPVFLVRESRTDAPPTQLIIGLISGQQLLNEEVRTIYGTTTLRHRFGLASVVHASMILETLELLK
ncbi:general stress protein 17O [Pirellula staleyi DSM 6068]|uniref:General stress protein 17O n=1 Tax=Pirellula staleyi (strain ATCC 27377 / DSM 6068 / ICPB 4128) TaxID=530564 RepID=D2R782_PIRSD|nr:general stress protein 17O [Pirellula staleyi DSM 6068]